jgi:transposase
MPKPRSPQLRELIVNSINQGMSISEAVLTYQTARRTIYYYLQRSKAAPGGVAPVESRSSRSKLENYREAILAARNANPGLSMRELCELLKLPVCPSTLSRTLAAWNLAVEHEKHEKHEKHDESG